MQPMCSTASVSANTAFSRRETLDEIAKQLEDMTEDQRIEYLLWLKKTFDRERSAKLGCRFVSGFL